MVENQSPRKSKRLTDKQYEELGRIVAAVYETGYLSAARSYRQSFIKGLFQGFGGVIGATILVALLLWLLSFFDQIPLIGTLIERVQETMNSAN